MKRYTAITLLLLTVQFAFGQTTFEDVIYLIDGSVLRGSIIDQSAGSSVKIEIFGGSIFVVKTAEIERIAQEEPLEKFSKTSQKPLFIKESGYKMAFEFGFLIPTQGDGFNQGNAPLLIQSHHGYQFFTQFYAAAGVGIERYGDLGFTFAPLFVSISGELLKKQITPYYFANVGYTFPMKSNLQGYNEESQKGGPMVQAGIGMKVNTRSKVGFILSVGYKFEKFSQSYEGWNWWIGIPETVETTHRFRRITVTTGFTF